MKINTMFGTVCIGCNTGNTVGLASSLTLPAASVTPSSVGSYGGIGLSLGTIPSIPGIQLDTDNIASPNWLPVLNYIVASRIFTFTATNLKPNTLHTWAFASLTGTVTTDSAGSVIFTVNYNPGNGTYSTVAASLSTINGLTGGVTMSIYNSDYTSTATCTVTLVSGGTAPVTNPTATIIPVSSGGRISCGVQRCGSAYN